MSLSLHIRGSTLGRLANEESLTESTADIARPSSTPSLIRAIGRWALTAAVINGVIGSGVFGLPSSLAGFAGAWSPLTVLIAGVGIFMIVLCFAEVGSRFDQAGGPYLYTREAFGSGGFTSGPGSSHVPRFSTSSADI
jgi:amino acid permease